MPDNKPSDDSSIVVLTFSDPKTEEKKPTTVIFHECDAELAIVEIC